MVTYSGVEVLMASMWRQELHVQAEKNVYPSSVPFPVTRAGVAYYVGCPKGKFPYAVKNHKNTLKILKKSYFIPFEYIIFPRSRQKDSSIHRTSRLIFVRLIGRTVCLNLSQCEKSTFVKVSPPSHRSLSFPALVMLNDDLC